MSGEGGNKNIHIKCRASSWSKRPHSMERRVQLETIEIVRIWLSNEVEATGVKIQVHVSVAEYDSGRQTISEFLYSPDRKGDATGRLCIEK